MGTARIQPRGVASITAIFASISNRINRPVFRHVFVHPYCWRMKIFLPTLVEKAYPTAVRGPLPHDFRWNKTPARFDPNNLHRINNLEKAAIPPEPLSIPSAARPIPRIGIIRPADPTRISSALGPRESGHIRISLSAPRFAVRRRGTRQRPVPSPRTQMLPQSQNSFPMLPHLEYIDMCGLSPLRSRRHQGVP